MKQPDGNFLTKGATIEDLQLMRKHSAPHVQIKAAGGIRNLKDMLAAIEAGATRIGATAMVVILEDEGLAVDGSQLTDNEDKGSY